MDAAPAAHDLWITESSKVGSVARFSLPTHASVVLLRSIARRFRLSPRSRDPIECRVTQAVRHVSGDSSCVEMSHSDVITYERSRLLRDVSYSIRLQKSKRKTEPSGDGDGTVALSDRAARIGSPTARQRGESAPQDPGAQESSEENIARFARSEHGTVA